MPKFSTPGLLLLLLLPGAAVSDEEAAITIEDYVTHYCGGCHKVPPAATLPRSVWPMVVNEMTLLAADRLGESAIPSEAAEVITQYYVRNAPENLPRLPVIADSSPPLTFRESAVGPPSRMPLIVNIKAVNLGFTDTEEFLVCDGERNTVSLLYRQGQEWRERILAYVPLPSHTEVADYDGDGDADIIVAALGVFPPVSLPAGKVVLLRQGPKRTFSAEVLLEDVGRIADARPVDIDNDGDYDIAVAIFGGGDVGEIAWLENKADGRVQLHTILKVPGALNVSPVDLNQDGRLDIVSLIAQEHEAVIAMINEGEGQFDTVSIASAGHPLSGSTGMRIVDLDGDQDSDILFTNGDAQDLDPTPKPYHGVQWLENTGNLEFSYHEIGRFYGTASARAVDVDGDGDLDVVASSWNNYWEEPGRQSLVWFENDGHQQFEARRLFGPTPGIVSFETVDMTDDGLPEILAGLFHIGQLQDQIMAKVNNARDPTEDITESSVRLMMLTPSLGARP